MAKFILRRFLYALLLLLIASILIFYGLRVAPGDVTGSVVSVTGGQQLVSEVKERLGLNEPLATQYFIFLKNVVSGHPGSSLVIGAKITDVIQDAAVKTWNDVLATETTFGGEGAGSDPNIFALLYRNVFGARIKLVAGYPGTNEITLATERKEVDGLCGLSWSTLKGRYPHWLNERKANILVQAGIKKQAELRDVPAASELATRPEQRQILNLILIGQAMARPFAAPPGIPADRKAALIAGFDRTMRDAEFLAEAGRLNLDVNPVPAARLDALLAEAYATPKEVVAKAARAMSD